MWTVFGGCSLSPEKHPPGTAAAAYQLPDYAERFRWRTCGKGQCMEILQSDGAVLTTVYRDSAVFQSDDALVGDAVVLSAGTAGLATLSSTHVALMEPWDPGLQHWKGGGFLEYVRSDAAMDRMASGEVYNFGGNPEWNHEAIWVADVRAFCIYPFGNPLQGVEWASELPVVPLVEYEEPLPLGRAEWMVALAWLVGDSSAHVARGAFEGIARRYEQIQQAGRAQRDSLVVLTGSVEQGAWSAPHGGSLVAHLLEDAGAKYAFAASEGPGNVELSLEQLYALREQVDALGLVVFEPDTLNFTIASWLEDNPHHAGVIPASAKVFAANTKTCDYFGWWVAHPDALLANVRSVLYGPFEGGENPVDPCFEWLTPSPLIP
jgi:hypothetical protein